MARYIEPTAETLALITDPDIKERVIEGQILVCDPETWYDSDRPVLRHAETKALVKGSGRIKGAKDVAVASKETAFTRRKGYRAWLESYIPPDLEDSPNAIISFSELVQNLIDACNGVPAYYKCQHDGCNENHQFVLKRDPGTLYKLIENLSGKARETQDININSTHMAIALNERFDPTELMVRRPDPQTTEAKYRIIEEAE